MPNVLKLNETYDTDSNRVSIYSSHNGISGGKINKEHFKAKSSAPINKAIVNIYSSTTNKYKILNDIRINPISNKPFYANLINVIFLNFQVELNRFKEQIDIQYFRDVLRLIYYHLNTMLDASNENELSVQFSKKMIISILQKFEK